MENTDNLHTIRRIRCASEIDPEISVNLLGNAGLTGYMGLIALNGAMQEGVEALKSDLGWLTFNTIAVSVLAIWLGAFIKAKITAHTSVKRIREESGLTPEEQRAVLEELVVQGNTEAIELFDYFYGAKKRKAL